MWFTIIMGVIILMLLIIIAFMSKALMVQVKKNDIHEQWIITLQNNVKNVYQTMHELDNKQMFIKDDEVGSVFQQMLELIDKLNTMTTNE
jgi:hypothetical protein